MLLEYTLPALVAATVILSSTARTAIAARWRKLIETVRDPYQPELHYMRGPGPKWRAKYQTDRARTTLRSSDSMARPYYSSIGRPSDIAVPHNAHSVRVPSSTRGRL